MIIFGPPDDQRPAGYARATANFEGQKLDGPLVAQARQVIGRAP